MGRTERHSIHPMNQRISFRSVHAPAFPVRAASPDPGRRQCCLPPGASISDGYASVGQTGASLVAAPGKNLAAVGRGHSLPETMDFGSVTLFGLIGTQHLVHLLKEYGPVRRAMPGTELSCSTAAWAAAANEITHKAPSQGPCNGYYTVWISVVSSMDFPCVRDIFQAIRKPRGKIYPRQSVRKLSFDLLNPLHIVPYLIAKHYLLCSPPPAGNTTGSFRTVSRSACPAAAGPGFHVSRSVPRSRRVHGIRPGPFPYRRVGNPAASRADRTKNGLKTKGNLL